MKTDSFPSGLVAPQSEEVQAPPSAGPAAPKTVSVEKYKELGAMFEDNIVVMQAAWIEWRHGKGAEAAMQWIENTLCGPGLLPGGEYSTEAQAYFDANKSDPFPRCFCGRPSHIAWMDQGFCSDAHHDEARAKHTSKG